MEKQPTESQQMKSFRSAIANAVVGILLGAIIGPISGSMVGFVGGWLSVPILQSLNLLSTEPDSEGSAFMLAFVLALLIGFTAAPAGALTGLAIVLSGKQTNSIIAIALVVGIIQATFLASLSSPWTEKILIILLFFTVTSNLIVALGISKLLKRT